MSETRITKSRHLLDLMDDDREADEFALFVSEPHGYLDLSICLPAADFSALGEPQQITVTIEPGDLLNDAEATR